MKTILIKAYDFNLDYAKALVADVKEKHMAEAGPVGLENHPAFILGHLCVAAAMTSKYLGGSYSIPAPWEPLFRRRGPGDPGLPEQNNGQYPTRSTLLNELEQQHEQVKELIGQKDENDWEQPVSWRFSEAMPTLADLVYFMCVTHENMHLGQLPAWRRHFGYPSALATLYPKK